MVERCHREGEKKQGRRGFRTKQIELQIEILQMQRTELTLHQKADPNQ